MNGITCNQKQTACCTASELQLRAKVHQQGKWRPRMSFWRGFPFYASYQYSLSQNKHNLKHMWQTDGQTDGIMIPKTALATALRGKKE